MAWFVLREIVNTRVMQLIALTELCTYTYNFVEIRHSSCQANYANLTSIKTFLMIYLRWLLAFKLGISKTSFFGLSFSSLDS